MAHLATRSGYQKLVQRLNKGPQGAPPSELLFQILKILMSEKEAALVALVPFKPFTVKTAARAWKMNEAEAQKALDDLASRALLIDIEGRRNRYYVLPPPMAGFFEFSMMRVRSDLDQKLLAELLYQYLNVEEEFVRDLFGLGETRLGRVFVNEAAVPAELSLHVLDYERASEVVRT
ncbi:MAG: (Fe-S)-binding protein, partial [Candidatus Aminicenantes bacterium]|nr:(Fe-S)-binding protein [Candidatus Aminicenantes bacterium]